MEFILMEYMSRMGCRFMNCASLFGDRCTSCMGLLGSLAVKGKVDTHIYMVSLGVLYRKGWLGCSAFSALDCPLSPFVEIRVSSIGKMDVLIDRKFND